MSMRKARDIHSAIAVSAVATVATVSAAFAAGNTWATETVAACVSRAVEIAKTDLVRTTLGAV